MSALHPFREQHDVTASELTNRIVGYLDEGYRLALVAAHHDGAGTSDDSLRVVYSLVAGRPDRRVELTVRVPAGEPLQSIAEVSFPGGRFDREIQDLFAVRLEAHHEPSSLILHPHWPKAWGPMRTDAPTVAEFGDMNVHYPFLTVEGSGVYEIPVGPVHAGIIEPGHFRFSVVGEMIVNLRERLWFLHRGVEKLFEGRPYNDGAALAERISGDTAVGHNLAYSLAIEEACATSIPDNAQMLRVVLLEMERLYNHVSDMGMMGNDIAFGIAHANGQRIRERLLRLNKRMTGHRYLRGGVVAGGASVEWLPRYDEIRAIGDDIGELAEVMLDNSTLIDRFALTASLANDDAAHIGVLGYVARASGLSADARDLHPFTSYYHGVEVPIFDDGDCLARFNVRVEEVKQSVELLARLLPIAESGTHVAALEPAQGPGHGLGLVEGWRGTIAHRVEIEPSGTLTRVKVVDPSFFNWPALPVAVVGDTIVPDFPLANKSFNLSYAGNDL